MIIKRSIYREIIHRFFWVGGLLLLIYASDKCIDYLAAAASGKIPSTLVFELLGLKLVSALPKLLPVMIYLAVVLTYARLAADNELLMLQVVGLGPGAQIALILQLIVPLSVAVAGITFWVAPWGEQQFDQLQDQARRDAEISGISPGKFMGFDGGGRVVYVESFAEDATTMRNVFLRIGQQEETSSVLTAATAKLTFDEATDRHVVTFENGRRYEGTAGQPGYRVTNYRSYAIMLTLDDPTLTTHHSVQAIPTGRLITSDNMAHQAELQWRGSVVLICLLLAIFAVLISHLSLADKPYLLIGIAMLVYFIYNNLLGIAHSLLKRGEIPAMLGLWWVHVAFLIVIAILYYLPAIRRSV